MKHLQLILWFSLLLTLQTKAQDFKKYDKGSFIDGKDSISYRILFPENFDPKQKYPVLFFLHGSGERGNDNTKQLTHGGKLFLRNDIRKQYPAIVIFPQCPEDSFWANVEMSSDSTGKRVFNYQKSGKPTKAMKALLGMIDNILDKPYINHQQVYIGGLSMGGMGTFELLRRKPKTFAAAFSICGGDNIANADKYKKIPLWIFHGGKDDVVPPAGSTAIANQLKIIGKEVKFTLYPDANHNSWDSAFAEPQLLPWLFSHKK
ncbi:putative peptidase [Pedobacter cryoconitis]|uniref:Putative peptidase n=1 Tax=Pedobacter cryoconitis TaxID=188932 RepID=A0A7W8ZLR1_9SPHI|nr:prolyl oligopeptidase family serine peptidase [Pedobacter cryoconitis]MBB5636333.1 putative peptidase [Pedobacter cryoconitis]MBB6274610.1 putative peptidase [Pedobacter cryoconitis]